MKNGNAKLNELIEEGKLLLSTKETPLPDGLPFMNSVDPSAFYQWTTKIHTFLDSEFSGAEKEAFDGLIRPNNTSVSTVKKILTYLNSLLEG